MWQRQRMWFDWLTNLPITLRMKLRDIRGSLLTVEEKEERKREWLTRWKSMRMRMEKEGSGRRGVLRGWVTDDPLGGNKINTWTLLYNKEGVKVSRGDSGDSSSSMSLFPPRCISLPLSLRKSFLVSRNRFLADAISPEGVWGCVKLVHLHAAR